MAEAESTSRYRQTSQIGDELLSQIGQGEALDFLNDLSLLLYGKLMDHDHAIAFTETSKGQMIVEQILDAHRELAVWDYEFGRALSTVSDSAWHRIAACIVLVAADGQPQETIAELFDYMLHCICARGLTGHFVTPRTLADMMAEMLSPNPGDLVIDPVCGSGRLLVAAFEKCRESRYVGIDINKGIVTTACFHLLFHKMRGFELYQDDCLNLMWKDKGDVIIANPPYSDDLNETIKFVEKIMDMLKPEGRCAVLVPEGFLTITANRNVVHMRRKLLRQYSLEGVVSLPRKMYRPYTESYSSLLLLSKRPAPSGHRVFFSRIPEYDGIENEFSDDVYAQSMKQVAEAWKRWKQEKCEYEAGTESGIKTETGNKNGNKNENRGENGNENEVFWTASPEEIEKKEYIFGAEHYRKREYMYTKLQMEILRESILDKQGELNRNIDHYFREDSVI